MNNTDDQPDLIRETSPVKMIPVDPVPLPNGCKMVVNLTVDFDAMIYRKHLDEPPCWVTQGEFGGRVGLPRLLDLLDKYDIQATIFAPGRVCELYPKVLQRAAASGHEIANHMWEHYIPQDPDLEREHFIKTDDAIEKICGIRPSGTRSEHHYGLLHEFSYKYASYLPMDDGLYYKCHDSGPPILNLPMNLTLDDAMFFYFGWFSSTNEQQRIQAPDAFYSVVSRTFRSLYSSTGYMNIVVHPNIIGRASRILMLEKLIEYMHTYDGVAFISCLAFVNHVLKTAPLDYS